METIDGSLMILPAQFLEKISGYFKNSGENNWPAILMNQEINTYHQTPKYGDMFVDKDIFLANLEIDFHFSF